MTMTLDERLTKIRHRRRNGQIKCYGPMEHGSGEHNVHREEAYTVRSYVMLLTFGEECYTVMNKDNIAKTLLGAS